MDAADIVKGLNVNVETIHTALKGEYDSNRVKATALALAADLSTYDNSRAAGRLLIFDCTRPCGTVKDYAMFMEPRLHVPTYTFLIDNATALQTAVAAGVASDYEHHDLFSASTMIKTYLMKPTYGEDPWETPQQLYLRVAVFLFATHGLERVLQCYRELSAGLYTPASPSLFNLGTKKPQGSSCFLIKIGDDLYEILYTGVGDCGMISKLNGGLGIGVSDLRHSMIGDVGVSAGIMPALRVYDKSVKYVDQGGKRDGAATVVLRMHHIDAREFIQATDNFMDHQFRFSTLNTCMWMSRLFFKRVEQGGKWTVFCPAKAKALKGLYGHEFEIAYVKMELLAAQREQEFEAASDAAEALRKRVFADPTNADIRTAYMAARMVKINARKARIEHKVYKADDLYDLICDVQIKSGMPYIMHGDSVNAKSNQKNLGTIDQTNLCLEVLERTNARNPDGIPSCNLHSMNMAAYARDRVTVSHTHPDFLKQLREAYDFGLYGRMTGSVVENLEELIDKNYYPLDEHDADGNVTKRGKISSLNFDMRNLGIGVSGWSDAVALMDLAYDDPRTEMWNKLVFACSYFNGMVASIKLAIERGEYYEFRTGSYQQYTGFTEERAPDGKPRRVPQYVECKGSPLANGQFQFDLWAEEAQYLSDFGELDAKVYNREDDKPMDPLLWGQKPISFTTRMHGAEGMDITITIEPTWAALRAAVMRYGVRHSLLFALMPTASTAQTFRNAESTEAHQANLYTRQVISGNYTVINRHLDRDLTELKCWTPKLIQFLGACKGSVEWLLHYIEDHPAEFRHVFEEKTTFMSKGFTVTVDKPKAIPDTVEVEVDGDKYTEALTVEQKAAIAACTAPTITLQVDVGLDLNMMGTGTVTLAIPAKPPTEVTVTHLGIEYKVPLTADHLKQYAEAKPGSTVSLVVSAIVEQFAMHPHIRARLTWLIEKYKTMFEISQKVNIRYAAQRGRYVCQSQSLNIYVRDPTKLKLKAIHSYTNKIGLKTGMYYLRQDPAKFTGNFSTDADILRYYMSLLARQGGKVLTVPTIDVSKTVKDVVALTNAFGSKLPLPTDYPAASPRPLTIEVPAEHRLTSPLPLPEHPAASPRPLTTDDDDGSVCQVGCISCS